jgi:hypothetical protein
MISVCQTLQDFVKLFQEAIAFGIFTVHHALIALRIINILNIYYASGYKSGFISLIINNFNFIVYIHKFLSICSNCISFIRCLFKFYILFYDLFYAPVYGYPGEYYMYSTKSEHSVVRLIECSIHVKLVIALFRFLCSDSLYLFCHSPRKVLKSPVIKHSFASFSF